MDCDQVRQFKTPEEGLAFFEAIERRLACQARATTLIAGLTAIYMVVRLQLWSRFDLASYWWMHAMIIVWLLFTVMLFITESLLLHRRFHARAKLDPEGVFELVQRLRRLLTILGVVAGSHGLLFFE